jgi:hypothetical protein
MARKRIFITGASGLIGGIVGYVPQDRAEDYLQLK